MSELSCHFKTKFMKIDITMILEYPTFLNVILLEVILPKRAKYAHSKFNLVLFETYFS
jgi:hypothetical protein